MNAHVNPSAFTYYTPQQRAQQALAAVQSVHGITAESVGEFHHLLGNIFLQASLCAAIGNEFLEGRGDDTLAEKMLQELGNIKSNLMFIGSVINKNNASTR
jgi:hypothetical protein